MARLVEWRAPIGPGVRPGLPGYYAGAAHAVVDGDLLTLCGQLAATNTRPLTGPATGVPVCPACAEITRQLAAGLVAHIHEETP